MGQDLSIGNFNLKDIVGKEKDVFKPSTDIIIQSALGGKNASSSTTSPTDSTSDTPNDGTVATGTEGTIEEFEPFNLAAVECWNIEEGLKARNKSLGAAALLDGVSLIRSVQNFLKNPIGSIFGTGYQSGTNNQGGPASGMYGSIAPLPSGTIVNPIPGYTGTPQGSGHLPEKYTGIVAAGHYNPDGWGFWASRSNGSRNHKGIDLCCNYGDVFVAPVDGVITSIHPYDDGADLGGISMNMDNGQGHSFYFCHLEKIGDGIVPGVFVKAGQILGTVGDSGNAKGGTVHLHFGWYIDGLATDPYDLLVNAMVL